MSHDRHSIGPSMPVSKDASNNLQWKMQIFREGVTEPVDEFFINSVNLPPRLSKQKKVLWRLPIVESQTLRLAVADRDRVMDLFKARKRKRKEDARKAKEAKDAKDLLESDNAPLLSPQLMKAAPLKHDDRSEPASKVKRLGTLAPPPGLNVVPPPGLAPPPGLKLGKPKLNLNLNRNLPPKVNVSVSNPPPPGLAPGLAPGMPPPSGLTPPSSLLNPVDLLFAPTPAPIPPPLQPPIESIISIKSQMGSDIQSTITAGARSVCEFIYSDLKSAQLAAQKNGSVANMYNEAAQRIYVREGAVCKSISVGQAHSFASSEQEIGTQLQQILGQAEFQISTCVSQKLEGFSDSLSLSRGVHTASVLVAGNFKALGSEKAFSQTFIISGLYVRGDTVNWRIKNDMLVIM
ncbi:hypothetical protein TrLO_g9713 [Triparma laevis f. longispina]|uniref:NTF2 domain-containing protein n=1 Tax=Triparma laevis f. longispina TaxID=1714387 RepID=A0A9W7E1U3_9STRA|nr:hypothetical protein TrLO_g9713 [Triparma laevis f. longispina]